MVPTFLSILCANKLFYCYMFPTYTVTVGLCVVMACWGSASKDWHSRVIAGLFKMLSSEVRMDNGTHRIAGMGMNEKVSDNRSSSEWYLFFLAKESISNPWGGMEDVCRVVVTMHDLMGLGFSLSNQINAKFWVRKPKRVGLFAHTKVTVTCEWPVIVTWSLHIS